MRNRLYTLLGLLVVLAACRVEQPAPYLAVLAVHSSLTTTSTSAVAIAPVPAASLPSAISTQQAATSTARRHSPRSLLPARLYWRSRRTPSAVVARPHGGGDLPMRPVRGLIICGAGTGLAVGSLFATPTTFGGALLVGGLFGVGVAFALLGLGYYLLALYDNRRVARANRAGR